MPHQHADLSIGALAEAAGVSVETIRFYQRKRLLATPRRRPGEIRRYALSDVARVKFVKASQRLGFTLDETAALLKLDDGTRCDEARALAEQKLTDVRSKLLNLRQLEAALKRIVMDCRSTEAPARCPLIASLQSNA